VLPQPSATKGLGLHRHLTRTTASTPTDCEPGKRPNNEGVSGRAVALQGLNRRLVMDDVLPQLGLALLISGVGLPVLTWFVLRFPRTTGAFGLLGVVLELLRIAGEPGHSVRPSCGDSPPPPLATPRTDPGFDRGNGLRGPEIRL
jgi:hypothetical protein